MRPWHHKAASLFLFSSLSVLTACSGGGADSDNEGDIIAIEPPVNEPPVELPGGIVNTSLPFHEDFGDGFISTFDEVDTQFFLSPEYKSLTTATENAEYEDSYPALWYPTCCFFVDEKNPDPAETEINLEELGIVSDAGNPSLLISNARLTVGQTRSELANPEAKTQGNTDRKKDSSAGDAELNTSGSWGEFDLSQPYRVSFCVKAARGGAGTMLIYVDNNQSNTNSGSSIHTNSLIFNAGTSSTDPGTPVLIPGQRVEINVPGDTTFATGGDIQNQIVDQIGSATSFLQFRVPSDGGAQVIIDDLLIEHQSNASDSPPACGTFTDATPPDTPEAGPNLLSFDTSLAASWDSLPSAVSYDLAWNTTGETPTAANEEGISGTSHTIAELENDTTYYVFLRGSNSAGTSGWSPAATGTPKAPEGENCSATTSVAPSPANMITWNLYDGCMHPGEFGAVVVEGSQQSNFSFSEEEMPWFSVDEKGIMTLNTIGGDADTTKPVGDLDGIVGAVSYPMHFTWIVRIDNSFAVTKDGTRGFEIESHIDGRRIKAILRPDSGKFQLEKFLAGDITAEVADVNFTGGYHTYRASFTVNDPAVDPDNISATIYQDGAEIGSFAGPGRSGGASTSRMRMGEGSSSPFHADLDWLLWSDNPTAAGLTTEELIGELPSGIGELDSYLGEGQDEGTGPSAALNEDFDAATEGDGSGSSFFKISYKSTLNADNEVVPYYNAIASSSRINLSDGALSFNNARFTLGDPTAGNKSTTAGDLDTHGVIDLSKPYIISFDVTTNNNAADGSGKCQVYVDNDGTSSDDSIWGGDSKIFESPVLEIASGSPNGTVIIASDPADHVGTATSFIQFRCDSGVEDETPITIDNLVIQYQ